METINCVGTVPQMKKTDISLSDHVNLIIGGFSFDYPFEIDVNEANEIRDLIVEENEINGKHMLEKAPHELISQVKANGCGIVKFQGRLVGFINLMAVEKDGMVLNELGSLIVKKDFRNRGIGRVITGNFLEGNKGKPIYVISNSKTAIRILESLNGLRKIGKSELPAKLLSIIELPGALLDDDIIFINIEFSKLIDLSDNR